jgi:hypothetical protein
MLELFVAVIINLVSIALMLYVARFWFRAWRERGSSAAHGLAISSASAILLMILLLVHGVTHPLLTGENLGNMNWLIVFSLLLYSTVQVMFARGYFSKEKET